MNLNLLPSQAKFQAARIKLKARIKIFLIGISSLWLILIMVVVGMWMVSNAKVNTSVKKYNEAVKQYVSLSNNVTLSERLKYQAKLVGKILNERFQYSTPLRNVSKLFSDKITVEKFDIREQNSFVLGGFFSGNKNMDEIEKKTQDINSGLVEGFTSAKVTALTTVAGSWKFEVEVTTK